MNPSRRAVLLIAVAALTALPLAAQREPVLKQIDLPHPYYYREMYLPQLTSGPGAVTWSPDSQEVIYSMQGSLWRQRLDSGVAEQLTFGPGYDYQPDWSPDGRSVVYAKYNRDAIELWLLDLETTTSKALTANGQVNVEPRWAPDGRRLAFVSTSYNRRFHIFVMQVENGKAKAIERLTGETRTAAPRYYYSPFDHEISPTWSPDGSEIIFVSNRGRQYGTGGFWRMKAEAGAEPREIHYEETTWKARPDWSPDGKKLLYSSYAGRQWHQLWLTTPAGGDPFPISYGEYDNTNARWSPDGKRIAFISNRDGNTALWIQEAVGGRQWKLEAKEPRSRLPMGRLELTVLDPEGRPTPARVSITGDDARAYAPAGAWIHADDSFVRAERRFEPHYFHTSGRDEIVLPAGRATVEVMKGFEHRLERRGVEITAGRTTRLVIRLEPLAFPEDKGANWVSGDLHVHMNYGGAFRNTPVRLLEQARAEKLGVVHNLIVNKEQRVPDIGYFDGKPDPHSTNDVLVMHDQEFHTSFWGHLGLLGLTRNFLLPDYAGYPNTAAASLYPTNSRIADLAREQGALVGYVHPYEIGDAPDPAANRGLLRHALVVDVALGKVDYLEVLGFSDHITTAGIWYRFLNLGFRLPAGAGTDAMMNFASLRGPLGTNRTYVRVPPGPVKAETWLEGLRRGRTFATNGPLLDFQLGGQPIGGELKLEKPGEVEFTASLRSIVPVEHLEVVCNGQVVREVKLEGARDFATIRGALPVTRSGWCLLRAWSEKPQYPILDIYPYATTSPIYITVAGQPPRSPEDAAFFLAWLDRMKQQVEQRADWNTPEEKAEALAMIAGARAVYARHLK